MANGRRWQSVSSIGNLMANYANNKSVYAAESVGAELPLNRVALRVSILIPFIHDDQAQWKRGTEESCQ